MPAFAIRVTPVPPEKIKELQIRFTKLAGHALDTKPLMESLGEAVREVIDKTFVAQGRRGGGSWANLSYVRQSDKARYQLDPRILYATHRLHDSLTDRRDSDNVFQVESHGYKVRVGTKLPYAKAHWTGATTKHGGIIPQRKWYKPTQGDRTMYVDIARRYFWTAWTGGEGRMGGKWLV